jgi:protease PrsW
MKSLIILSLAFAPGVFWLWYFFRLDKLEPEPLHLVRTSFLLGMAAVIPAALIELPFARISSFAAIVLVAPVVEELCKYLVVRLGIYRNAEFDEPMDGVIYAVATALGFASLENVFYLLAEYGKGSGPFAVVTVTRALLSVPGHALWSGMWGYALGCAKFSEPRFGRSLVIRGLTLAIGLHALFNLLCLSGPIWPLGMVILVPIMWRMMYRRIDAALRASPHTYLAAPGGHTPH